MNFGYWYYREYFNTIKLNSEGIVTNFSTFNKKEEKYKGEKDRDELKNVTLLPHNEEVNIQGIKSFELKTCYPGLLCGVGYHHEINKPKDEGDKEDDPEVYNLGMYFDYTSGLPVIPGSSIKGMLRSAIEEWDFLANYEPKDENKLPDKLLDKKVLREELIKTVFEGEELIDDGDMSISPRSVDVNKREKLSIYDRDIFLDAIPVKVDNKLFGEDYITPHPDPLKNPNPIRFLRVNPGVTYKFRFILKDHKVGLTAKFTEDLFKAIICEFGLGAKTNVGYGQFV
ncbi:type III-B CRISPR module RAMP protein Cmr6 [Porphyromonas circumdentaria]|uniref:type III-B CRISPR module RAMP protein Cmr6 n=1 Tax=Porphyromonas circumdentaria TaxID=29524 RepID=UPI0026DC2179|nr:type III-B CRISPR module RAMP protein Cmr6 [Porphyromonas circumdentaria]MDO4722886.1 type III-B CRISPR module RAMP protein Cmr6 [Porphyromonas circumdentaria]